MVVFAVSILVLKFCFWDIKHCCLSIQMFLVFNGQNLALGVLFEVLNAFI